MSKKWRVAMGVIVAAVVVSGIGLLRLGGVVYQHSGGEYGWGLGTWISELVWGTRASAHLPERGWGPGASAHLPELGWGAATYEGRAEEVLPWEVDLVDDDGDGIPDRRLIEVPMAGSFDRSSSRDRSWPFGYTQGRFFDRGFDLGHASIAVAPLAIVGGLARLAFLALLIGVGVVLYRRRSKSEAESRGNRQASGLQ